MTPPEIPYLMKCRRSIRVTSVVNASLSDEVIQKLLVYLEGVKAVASCGPSK